MKRLVVIGGGASGMFCAVNAARLSENLEVLVLEKTSKLLSKVRISGGGRCNVTHACFSVTEMLKKYPRGNNFLKKSFSQFFTQDTIAWFEERKVKLKTEPDGRVFPVSDDSQSIIDCLITESYLYGVGIEQSQEAKAVYPQADGTFEVHT
ncbi:MAG: NAD(P)/FAD-dependent oxidoreductase, partial [Verrucomicrobia bacterium]|nr:NAD(P)/FAD-dependent oxidoreductase [Cytophagales bacterium]